MLRCQSLSVTYGTTEALADVSLEVAEGSITAIMGESGSGKTTLLRVIAGLVVPDAGEVSWRGRDITAVPAHQRQFGLMFQDYALFPHLDVGRNIAFGLRMQNRPDDWSQARVRHMLDLVGLAGYESRRVADLSGGEQQRVGLARTLAPEPELVLLDEPLGALDRARRDQLLADMQRIFGELGVTALYVTHDHYEAFAVSDQVVVLDAGRKVAQGTPEKLWADPGDAAVATLLGFPVLADVSVSDGRAEIAGAQVPVRLPDGRHHIAFLPGAITIDADGSLDVEVLARRFQDGAVHAVVQLDGVELLAAADAAVQPGPTRARVNATRLVQVKP